MMPTSPSRAGIEKCILGSLSAVRLMTGESDLALEAADEALVLPVHGLR